MLKSHLLFLIPLLPLVSSPAWSQAAGGEPEQVLDTITATRVEPDGRFELFPRWTAPGRPTLALALSGGGLRGMAHLGVLQAMEEDGVEFDAIAGTSMGALVGAFVAGGYSAGEVAEILRRRDWNTIVGGLDAPRRALSESEDVRDLSALVRVRVRHGRLVQIGALVESSLLERELLRYLLRAQLESGGDFDRMKYRYRAVAGDILTGRAIVPSSGDLVSLVRGSSAIPGVFRPVPFGDALLVDGGVVENIPVATARSFGADATIAVDATERNVPATSLRGALDNLNRSLNILMAAQGDAALADADLVLSPQVKMGALLDFAGNLDRLVLAGRDAYREKRGELWSLLEQRAKDRAVLRYDALEIEGTAAVTVDLVAERLGGRSGAVTRFRAAAELARALNREPLEDGRIEWIERGGRRILRFVLRENPPLAAIAREGDESLPEELGIDVAIGRPFSLEAARSIADRAHHVWIDRGEVLIKLEEGRFDAATGTLLIRLSEDTIEHITTEAVGEFRFEGVRRLFEDLEGRRFSFDKLVDRLDGMVARGALLDWRIVPERRSDGGIELRVFLRGDDLFEVQAGAAWRDALGAAGFLRVAKANITGRGDFIDLILAGAQDSEMARARYHTEYFGGFTNVGAEVGVDAFDNAFPVVDASQKIDWDFAEQYEGVLAYAVLQRRFLWGIVGQGGVQYGRERLQRTDVLPFETRARASLRLRLDLNRHDRLLFPTRGASLKATLFKSYSGDSLSRFEVRGDEVFSPTRGGRHAFTGRFGLGLSDGADRRPYWFDPGGFRDLYGYVPYGAAAPQYARAGATWRVQWLDLGAARIYVEVGADAIRTGVVGRDLRKGGADLGYGASIVAYTRLLGPVTIGAARNDAGTSTVFLTAGYSF